MSKIFVNEAGQLVEPTRGEIFRLAFLLPTADYEAVFGGEKEGAQDKLNTFAHDVRAATLPDCEVVVRPIHYDGRFRRGIGVEIEIR